MKKVSRRELARVVAGQLIDGRDQKLVMRETAAYLIEHKMLAQADMVLNDIAVELQKETGHVSATVRTAFAPSSAVLDRLRQYIVQATGARSAELTVVHDPALIGGVIVQTPQYELDASVRHQLNQLAVERS